MRLYRIRNWGSLYENNRTRELKKLDWVPIPNKQDGDGYTALMEHRDGTAILGAFIACVQIASKCEPRGVLVRDGQKPHSASSLARMSRVPEALMQRALDILSGDEVGWLVYQEVTDNPAGECDNPAPSCDNPAGECLEGKGREGKKEGNEEPQGFADFYEAYPNKKARPRAVRAWEKIESAHLLLPRMLSAIESSRKSPTWTKNGGQFIPHPATWLNERRWEDQPVLVSKPQINHTGNL